MTDTIISNIVTVVIVILGFVGNAIYLNGNFGARITNTERDVESLKKNVRYKDTCESITHGLEGRIDRLETIQNNAS